MSTPSLPVMPPPPPPPDPCTSTPTVVINNPLPVPPASIPASAFPYKLTGTAIPNPSTRHIGSVQAFLNGSVDSLADKVLDPPNQWEFEYVIERDACSLVPESNALLITAFDDQGCPSDVSFTFLAE